MALARDRAAPVSSVTLWAGGAPLAVITRRDTSPVVALSLHSGHALRESLAAHTGLADAERLREEDVGTAEMAPESVTRVQVLRSRFEIDLNRPRFRAVYQGAADAWGLPVWDGELPDDEDRLSRDVYDSFYDAAYEELSRVVDLHGGFVVLDLHSYNHRREGASGPEADPGENPEVNLGTRRIDRERWSSLVDDFVASLSDSGFDVRENVKFGGGHFAHWATDTFGDAGCVLSVEFKKTYMDEWTGLMDGWAVSRIRDALTSAVPVLEAAFLQRREHL